MVPDAETARKVAEYLLQIRAIKLEPEKPFLWASGWKSPIYCDNRITLSYPHIRTYIKEKLATFIKRHYNEVEAVAGIATAGIAQGALVAEYLQLPFAYVRPEPKKHGMGNQIEGDLSKSQRVVLVEDVISTGSSSLKAVGAVRKAGCHVLGVASIFSYGFQVAENSFQTAQCPFFSLTNYDYLLTIALASNYIRNEDISTLKRWKEAPDKWNGST